LFDLAPNFTRRSDHSPIVSNRIASFRRQVYRLIKNKRRDYRENRKQERYP
jgi:hypothetical protein